MNILSTIPCPHLHPFRRLIVVIGLVCAFGPVKASAQSKDRDHPTRLTSPEITGFVDRTVAGDRYYYSIMAGPGELTFDFNVEAGRGMLTFATITIEVSDVNSRSIFNILANPNDGAVFQRSSTITLARKQPLLLQLRIDSQSSGGKYRVRVSGPLDLGTEGGQPSAGTTRMKLRVEMLDGTTQEIDLSRVRRLIWETGN